MKKFLKVFSILLVGALAVGGTLAYISSINGPKTVTEATADTLKIITKSEGIYKLGSETISLLGVAWNESLQDQLVVVQFGKQVPFWVTGSGKKQTITFYAPQYGNRYSDEMVTILFLKKMASSWGFAFQGGESDGTEIVQNLTSIRATTPGGVVQKEHLENNRVFQPLVESGDRWMGEVLMAPAEVAVRFNLVNYLFETGKIQVAMWASTEANGNPDHHLEFHLNGEPIGDAQWDGKGRRQISLDINADFLREGENILAITAPGDTGAIADFVWLDWVEIETVQNIEMGQQPFSFWGQGQDYQVNGMKAPVEVYDVTDPAHPSQITLAETNPTRWFGENGRRYLLIGKEDEIRPEQVATGWLDPNLRDLDLQAQYLAIGPADLLAQITPLVNLREKEGLSVKTIEVGEIYDQFNNGIKSPLAITAFLRWASENWKEKPQYLLLVGDASYDPRGYLPEGVKNVLPTFFASTRYGGETTSDFPFSITEAKSSEESSQQLQIPSLAVGRIPAQEPAQVKILVEKILAYEAEKDHTKGQRVLAVADGQDPSFEFDAQKYMERFSDSAEIYSPRGSDLENGSQVVERLNQGYDWLMYFGHGSVQQWGKDQLLTLENLAEENQKGHYLVAMQFTCLTGLFSHPSLTSLTEAMLWQPGGGVVASLAPTSLTLPTDQGYLVEALLETIKSQEYRRIGDVYKAAIQVVTQTQPQSVDVIQTFLLLGDPALNLP